MPGAEYSTEGRLGLRKLKGSSSGRQIGTGFQSLGFDIEALSSWLVFVTHSGSVTAEAGELLKMTATGTVTLPAASFKGCIGVICAGGVTTVKPPITEKIFGDFVNEAAEIKLLLNQHVILQSNGTNWFIIAGEPKREQAYSELVGRAEATPFTPSSTRPTFVALTAFRNEAEWSVFVKVGGITIGNMKGGEGTEIPATIPFSFICPPGVAWEWGKTGATPTVQSTYLGL